MTTLSRKVAREIDVLERFVKVYCREHHGRKDALCHECADLLDYATERLEACPYDPKPKCKDCSTHCYSKSYRERIRDVMRFSGTHFVKRGQLDWAIRYFM